MQIKRFNPETIKKHRIIIINGPRDTGKSTLLWDLMYRLRDRFDCVIGMSPSDSALDVMREHMPNSQVHPDYSEEKAQGFVDGLKRAKRKGRARSGLMVLDDCMKDKAMLSSPLFRDIAYNGRQFQLTLVLCMQYLMDMPPHFRTNVDYCFVLKEMKIDNRDRLRRYFFGILTSSSFSKVMNACTENRECLVLDSTVPSVAAEKCIFFYKAVLTRELPAFLLGHPVYRFLASYFRKRAQVNPNKPTQGHQDGTKHPPQVNKPRCIPHHLIRVRGGRLPKGMMPAERAYEPYPNVAPPEVHNQVGENTNVRVVPNA